MKTIVNDQLIARRARLGKIFTFAGLGLLLIGLIVSLTMTQTSFLLVSFGCLLGGIVASSIGTVNMNRWIREPRADQVLARGLKGFDDRYRLYNYVLPAPHVLLTPTGLYVLTAMLQEGAIRYEGGKWRRNFSLGRAIRFLGDEGLGRPFAIADSEVLAMQRFLEQNEAADGVGIENVLVFVHPKAQVEVHEPPRPVIMPKDLKRTIRGSQNKLSPDRYRRLQELFESNVALESVQRRKK
ncbi:MAG: hypothetical protein JXM73_11595 [Anaerolineae bacterium]|nr:hypothetical protein [Anaerolineae bacterium]